MRYLGHGRHRHAYKIGKYVVKVPRLKMLIPGIRACIRELYRYIKFRRESIIAPIRFSLPGLMIIMPYYEVRLGVKRPIGFLDRLKILGIEDICAYNVGWNGNDQPVVIDYGYEGIGACSIIYTVEAINNGLRRDSGWID